MKLFKTVLSASMLVAVLGASDANAYVISVTNGTSETIKVDPWGWGVIGGSLMQGKIHLIFYPSRDISSKSVSGSTTRWDNAGASHYLRDNKAVLPPGATVELNFNDIDGGMCFDWGNFKVGLESQGFSMVARPIGVVTGDAMQTILQNVQTITQGIAQAGGAAAAAGEKGKAVAEAIKGSSQIANGAVNVATTNGCGNRSITVTKVLDDQGQFHGVLKALLMQG